MVDLLLGEATCTLRISAEPLPLRGPRGSCARGDQYLRRVLPVVLPDGQRSGQVVLSYVPPDRYKEGCHAHAAQGPHGHEEGQRGQPGRHVAGEAWPTHGPASTRRRPLLPRKRQANGVHRLRHAGPVSNSSDVGAPVPGRGSKRLPDPGDVPRGPPVGRSEGIRLAPRRASSRGATAGGGGAGGGGP